MKLEEIIEMIKKERIGKTILKKKKEEILGEKIHKNTGNRKEINKINKIEESKIEMNINDINQRIKEIEKESKFNEEILEKERIEKEREEKEMIKEKEQNN